MEDDGVSRNVEGVQTIATSLRELKIEASNGPSIRSDQCMSKDTYDDEGIWEDESDGHPNSESNLKRDWNWRQNQFHTMGYREGITEGKKDSAQEGFNIGFKQSSLVGHKWGLIRGITSVLANLPESSLEKLIPNLEMREKLMELFKAVKGISSDDALRIYHQIIVENKSVQSIDCFNHSQEVFGSNEGTNSNNLENLYKDLVLVLREYPEIKVRDDFYDSKC